MKQPPIRDLWRRKDGAARQLDIEGLHAAARQEREVCLRRQLLHRVVQSAGSVIVRFALPLYQRYRAPYACASSLADVLKQLRQHDPDELLPSRVGADTNRDIVTIRPTVPRELGRDS